MTSNKSLSLPGSHNISRMALRNGITLLVYENYAAQSVVIYGSLSSGSLFETPEQNGLANLTSSAVMRGSAHYDYDTINSSLEDIGADLSVSAGVHRTSFYGKSLAEDLGTLVDVLADVLRAPTFPEEQVERLRGELITGLQIRIQDTRYRANRAFHEALYPPEHPYHYSTRGTLQSVPTLKVADLQAFHQKHYGPAGMLFVVSGAVKAAEAVEIIRARLEDWQNSGQQLPPALPDVPPVAETQRIHVNLPGKTQSDLVMGIIGPTRRAPDYQAATLANSVLGQFGMMGRIGASVREKLGLAYYAYSQVEGGLGPGPWSVAAGVNPANVELATERIVDELRRLTQEPVSDQDLSDNQSYHIGHLPLQLESNEGLASTILNMETFNLGLDYLVHYREMIQVLTKDDLLAAARHYLNPEALVVAVAGPNGK